MAETPRNRPTDPRRTPSEAKSPMDLVSGTGSRQGPRRDALTLAELYEQYNRYVLKRLGRYGVRHPADLEEQAMKVWEVVVERYGEFRGEAQLTTWLSEICRRVAADHRHGAWKRRAAHTTDGATPEPEPLDTDTERFVGVLDALSLLGALPFTLRQVLVLYYCEDRAAPEIAEILGMQPRQVYTLVENALKKLEEEIRRRGDRKETP